MLSEVRSQVRDAIEVFEPRVTLRQILVDYNDVIQELKVEIEYSFLDDEDTIEITLERVR